MANLLDGYTGILADMTLVRGARMADDDTTKAILNRLLIRIAQIKQEHTSFTAWCDRADGMYYVELTEKHGADAWPEHASAKVNGRQHVSVNSFAVYVDTPASLQAVTPIEDMLASDQSEDARTAASAKERVYSAWKDHEDFELKFHKATTIKGLYGRTAARVYWDADKQRPCVEVIQQPRNLFLGWKTDNFEELEWVAYRMYYDPMSLTEEYGVEVKVARDTDGQAVPMVFQRDWDSTPSRVPAAMLGSRIEVYDYWYREAVWSRGKFVRMKTMNCVVAGNIIIREPTEYPEYKGQLPYVPLFNTFVPGMPGGRPDLYDVEPLIREKMERITSGSQLIANVTGGDAYQLTGPDAPTRVPQGLKPVIGGVIAPGPGNRVEVIQPFIAQFQLEQFLVRIDRELAAISGLNELLLGLSQAQSLNSSKAINAFIANYETRLSMRRKLLYKWRRDVWELAYAVMKERTTGEVREGIEAIEAGGGGFLDISDPSLSPRDDMETMQRAINAINNKLWSQRTAMNIVGIDDPETEQDLIREERTDATMFPADVQVMAQLMAALQALGLNAPAAQGMAGQQAASGNDALRQALGAGANSTGMQSPDTQLNPPVIPGSPAEAQPAGASGAPFASGPDNAPVLQGMVQGGEAKGRIMTQQKLGRK
jgi:hypothetical protein